MSWQSQHQPTCCWKGSHILQGLKNKNIPQLAPYECLEPAEQEVEMLAMPGGGRGVVWGLPGLPRNARSSGSQVTAETWWILLALKARLSTSRKETPSKKSTCSASGIQDLAYLRLGIFSSLI